MALLLLAACSNNTALPEAALETTSAACTKQVNNTHKRLLDCVTLENVRAHQAAFQAIADANGGNRAAGTPGYDASVAYVVDTLRAAGYQVTLHWAALLAVAS